MAALVEPGGWLARLDSYVAWVSYLPIAFEEVMLIVQSLYVGFNQKNNVLPNTEENNKIKLATSVLWQDSVKICSNSAWAETIAG